jgi:DNA-binding NarL/FixJ family response regulator
LITTAAPVASTSSLSPNDTWIPAEVGFTVVGQVGDGRRLLDLVRADPPDVAVIDLRMSPGYAAEGIEAAEAIRRVARPRSG